MPTTVEIDKKDLFELQLTLDNINAGSKIAIMRATNDAIGGIKTKSVDEIYNKVALKKAVIRAAFKVNKMYVADLSAHIECAGAPVPLIEYQARSVNKGVTLKVLRNHERSLVRHAFITKVRAGKPVEGVQKYHTGVFWRKERPKGRGIWKQGKRMKLPSPTKGSRLREYQLKIHELWGPRIPDVFDDPEIMEPIFRDASKRFDDRLEHHTQRLLDAQKK